MPVQVAESATVAPLRKQLQSLIENSIDPERVAHYADEFLSRHSIEAAALASDPERLRWLTTIFAFSHFLSEELLRNPAWLFSISDLDRTLTSDEYRQRLSLATPAAFDLALFRRRQLLRIVLRDVLKSGTLPEVTEDLSNLADAIVACALETVSSQLGERYGTPQSEAGPATFTVLALGKLGGRELNYSSDIDLMFLYSGNGETSGPHKLTNREFFKKVANQLTNLLSTYTAAGLCYRVDLRLRPEGSLGEVSIPLAAAKEYYANRRRDWELQMLIKGRVAAGNEALGQELLDFVEPSIYSSSIDFSTIETMSETRERIGERLARKRLRPHDHDVKLARGGIRDIEFLVQCLQRLHGAREASLRHGSTLFAIRLLLENDLLSGTECSRLTEAYQFLRTLEHRLQFEDDRQTHSLPSSQPELERIARRMPVAVDGRNAVITASAQLLQDLNQHLENVQAIYERIVHAQRPLYYSPATAGGSTTDAAPQRRSEPARIGISDDLLRSVARVAPSFVEGLRRRGVQRSEGALAGFLENLLDQTPHLRSLDEHPVLADCMLQIFELSPHVSEQLTVNPELLEEIRRAADHPTRRWAFERMAAPLNDIDGLRRFFRREMFRIQAASVCLPESVFQTLDRTSTLAEFVIARAYRIALERALAHARSHATAHKPFEDPQSEMMIVALGRLGMREFDLASDADLLFIIPDSEAQRQRFWTRVAEHLIDILTTYAGDGAILSLDTRLRPNGREGNLVQTESKYVEYFSNKAEAWEGIAYMKSRAVAGDTDRATEFLSELQKVDWRRYGQSGRSKQDLRQMRMRLQREQGLATPLKAGYGGYYDADFILMYLRLKGAGMFFKKLNTPERIDVVEKMGHLEREDAEFMLQATTFFRALDHAVRVVTGRAEEKLPESAAEREMIAELMHRWTNERPSAATLEAGLHLLQTRMRALFDRIFAH
jgi:[glutamine synthetase] adenylyltransferase / [glutamine synthetase]-adenylyl-L-tyrosine phosphorylase